MNKIEALQQMEAGAKVTHQYYSDDEYCYMKDGQIYTEDGYCHGYPEDEFWSKIQQWLDGWDIFPETQVGSPVIPVGVVGCGESHATTMAIEKAKETGTPMVIIDDVEEKLESGNLINELPPEFLTIKNHVEDYQEDLFKKVSGNYFNQSKHNVTCQNNRKKRKKKNRNKRR
jgi:hypothetical protein